LQKLKYKNSNDGGKERESAWLLKAIPMLGVCVIFGHQSEASRQNFLCFVAIEKVKAGLGEF
jgi:hypothetical protein